MLKTNPAGPPVNPVTALRQRHRLSRTAFARGLGLGYWDVRDVEEGRPASLPRAFARALSDHGLTAVEVAELETAYRHWRASASPLDLSRG